MKERSCVGNCMAFFVTLLLVARVRRKYLRCQDVCLMWIKYN